MSPRETGASLESGSMQSATRSATRSIPDERSKQDDETFQKLVKPPAEEEAVEASGTEEQERTVTGTGNASFSASLNANKSPEIKKNAVLKKLQPRGEWKMYENLSIEHDRRYEQGRPQRIQDLPNYADSKSRVFGYAPEKNPVSVEAANANPGKKPRGRPPKGKVWDDDTGAYVSDDDAPIVKKAKSTAAKKQAKEAPSPPKTKKELVSQVIELKKELSSMRTEMADLRTFKERNTWRLDHGAQITASES